jgi:hypothetical protein
MVGVGHASAVAEFFLNGQGLAVPLQGLVIVATPLGDHPQLAEKSSRFGRTFGSRLGRLLGKMGEWLYRRPAYDVCRGGKLS